MKEKVVVFHGEDKFIKPRNRSYNVDKNYSNLVGDNPPPADYFPREDLNTTSYTTINVGGDGGGSIGGGNVGGGGIGVSTPQPDYQLPNTTTQPAPTTSQPAPTTSQPAPTTTVPTIPLPFITPTGFGVAPMGGIGGGGGGGGDEKVAEKKNYWWILILIGLGVGVYVYNKNKKK